MKGSDIQDLVIVKLEEYTPFKDEEHIAVATGGNDYDEVRPVESYVRKHMAQSANEMLRVMPIHLLRYKEDTDVVCVADAADNRIGRLVCPSDFLRLHTLQMEGWVKPVHQAAEVGGAVDALQQNRWTRGSKQKPVAVIDGEGFKSSNVQSSNVQSSNVQDEVSAQAVMELHYYSVDASDTHSVKVFRYVPVFDKDGEYGDDAAELIALNCARKVAEVFGMTEQATTFTNEITNVLENTHYSNDR